MVCFRLEVLVILVIVTLNKTKAVNNYCNKTETKCKIGTHVTCKEPVKGNQLQIINETMQQMILDFHNKYRNKIADLDSKHKAADMNLLYWDVELAELANISAMDSSQTTYTCSNLPGLIVKQNRGVHQHNATDEKLLRKIMSNWLIGNATLADVPKLQLKNESEPWLIMINAASDKIGCSYAVENNATGKFLVLVCNYGNGYTNGTQVYKLGKLCGACLSSKECLRSSKYKNLCQNKIIVTTPVSKETDEISDDKIAGPPNGTAEISATSAADTTSTDAADTNSTDAADTTSTDAADTTSTDATDIPGLQPEPPKIYPPIEVKEVEHILICDPISNKSGFLTYSSLWVIQLFFIYSVQ